MSPVVCASQEDSEGYVGEEEVCWDAIEDRWELGGADQAVGDIGVDAIGAGAEKEAGAQDVAGDDSSPSIFPFYTMAVDDIEFFALAPEAEEILGVALTVGIDLEHIRNLPPAGFAVTDETALSVAAIGLVEDFKARSKLLAQSCEDLRGAVGRTIVDGQEDEVLGPVFHFMEPLEDDFTDGGLLVEDRHDNEEFGGHELKRLRDQETKRRKDEERGRRVGVGQASSCLPA